MKIFSFIDMNCYKGLRHVDGLPCHGQRTRTNARSRKRFKEVLKYL
ncbi:MAG: 30S ribosomal protein S13 [Candidatus Riesia sp.]|nr:30S ribosomal protein S13 [Candidatus Riesia sp.]